MDALNLHCLSGKVADIDLSSGLNEMIVKLHTDRPLWRFKLHTRTFGKGAYTHFSVHQDDQHLGDVGWGWINRAGGNGYQIGSKLDDKRYRTVDFKKAYVFIKKTFMKKTTFKLMDEAIDEIKNRMSINASDKRRSIQRCNDALVKASLEYLQTDEGVSAFLRYVNAVLPAIERNTINKALEDKQKFVSERNVVEEIHANVSSRGGMYIIKADGNYAYRTKDDQGIYTNDTLPDDIRGKLGMLKLIEDEHYIENVGYRLNADKFVIYRENNNA